MNNIYSYNLKVLSTPTPLLASKGGEANVIYARVEEVILDSTHPDYLELGGTLAIGAVKFKPISIREPEAVNTSLNVAYPINHSVRIIPLVGEIVPIFVAPAEDLLDNSENIKQYYGLPVSIWNHPFSNIFLEDPENDQKVYQYFPEEGQSNPKKLQPGDIGVYGRLGQYLVFTSFTEDSILLPRTYLVNNQISYANSYEPITNIPDKDTSFIGLSRGGAIHTNTNTLTKRSYTSNNPININTYVKEQIVVNSKRVVINATEDHILLASKKSINLTGTSINLDASDYIGLATRKIYLGEDSIKSNNPEPVMLGHQTEKYLDDMLNVLEDLSNALAKAKTVKGESIPELNFTGASTKKLVESLKARINPRGKTSSLKSTKVFTS